MPLAWVPYTDYAEAERRLGRIPAGLDLDFYRADGDALPGTVDEVAFYVLPYMKGPAVLERSAEMAKLEVVQTLTAGYEEFLPMVPAAATLCNAAGVHDASTAELAVALILASGRHLDSFARNQSTGTWRPILGQALADQRVLIIGYGRIGEAIERRLQGFEVASVTRVARRRRTGPPQVHPVDDLHRLLPQADVAIVIAPQQQTYCWPSTSRRSWSAISSTSATARRTTTAPRAASTASTPRRSRTASPSWSGVDGIKAKFGSPVVYDGKVYIPNDVGVLFCLDAKTGEQKWSYQYGTETKGSPLLADGKIYIADVASNFLILKPGEDSCEEVSKLHFRPKNDVLVNIFGTPVVLHGRVYFMTADTLYCFGAKDYKGTSDPLAPEGKETPAEAGAKPANIQIVPADVLLEPGGSVDLKAYSFDEHGQPLVAVKVDWRWGRCTRRSTRRASRRRRRCLVRRPTSRAVSARRTARKRSWRSPARRRRCSSARSRRRSATSRRTAASAWRRSCPLTPTSPRCRWVGRRPPG